MNLLSLHTAIDYLHRRGARVPTKALVLARRREIKQAISYQPVRDELWAAVYDAVWDFLDSRAQVGTYARPMAAAVSKAYLEAADLAYVDGGGSLPMDEDTRAWAKAELSAQLGYVDSLFETLKQLRKEGDVDAIAEAFRRADSWASGLDGFYNGVKLAGEKNKMLTWHVGGTKQHCRDCAKLDGQRHRASWFLSRGYVPRRPGASQECGGYRCRCTLTDDQGEDVTI